MPAAGAASSGGSGLAPSPTPTAPASQPASQNGEQVVSASAGGITISSRASAVLRGALRVSGSISPAQAGVQVEIDRMGRGTGSRWIEMARATTAADGSFATAWRANHIGRFLVRAVLVGQGTSAAVDHGTNAPASPPTVTVTVFRPAMATIYGPGLYGNQTACGETLTPSTIGVANRTLPCGTRVALLYHGRTMIVPVIDRGPYTSGVDWDITEATASRLGLTGTGTVDAVSLPRSH